MHWAGTAAEEVLDKRRGSVDIGNAKVTGINVKTFWADPLVPAMRGSIRGRLALRIVGGCGREPTPCFRVASAPLADLLDGSGAFRRRKVWVIPEVVKHCGGEGLALG